MATAMLLIPKAVKAGEIVILKAIISHPMETGYRREVTGKEIPRDIIRRFSARYRGEEVMSMEMHAAIAANPFVAFTLRVETSGPVTFLWEGDRGFRHSETAELVVSP